MRGGAPQALCKHRTLTSHAFTHTSIGGNDAACDGVPVHRLGASPRSAASRSNSALALRPRRCCSSASLRLDALRSDPTRTTCRQADCRQHKRGHEQLGATTPPPPTSHTALAHQPPTTLTNRARLTPLPPPPQRGRTHRSSMSSASSGAGSSASSVRAPLACAPRPVGCGMEILPAEKFEVRMDALCIHLVALHADRCLPAAVDTGLVQAASPSRIRCEPPDSGQPPPPNPLLRLSVDEFKQIKEHTQAQAEDERAAALAATKAAANPAALAAAAAAIKRKNASTTPVKQQLPLRGSDSSRQCASLLHRAFTHAVCCFVF
jgi:hypothetical protein